MSANRDDDDDGDSVTHTHTHSRRVDSGFRTDVEVCRTGRKLHVVQRDTSGGSRIKGTHTHTQRVKISILPPLRNLKC